MRRSSVVAIIGKPNAGKSTLLNKVIGHKISIVTPKPQTTRNMINGIATYDQTQIVFLDTPGIFEARRSIDRGMIRIAWSSIHGADCILLLIDGQYEIDKQQIEIIERLKSQKIDPVFLINKSDLHNNKSKEIQNYINNLGYNNILVISALNGHGVDKVIDHITANAPIRDWFYSEDDITTMPMRFISTEITREQLFLHLHQELPYNLIVQTEKYEQNSDDSVTINQIIYVATESHKKIVLGKNGSMIRSVGVLARNEFSKIFEIQAHLFLHVSVKPKMFNDPNIFQRPLKY